MANPIVFSSALFEVNAKSLSNKVTSITPNYSAESLDGTAMGDGTRKHKGGLYDWTFDVTFAWEMSTTSPEAVLWGLVGTTVCVEYRDINICSSANNPILSGVATLLNFNRGGQVGTLLTATSQFAAFSALSRASSS